MDRTIGVPAPAEFGTFVFTLCVPSLVLGVRQTACSVLTESFFHAGKRDHASDTPSNLRTCGVLLSHLQYLLRAECSGSDASLLVLEFYVQ